MQESSKKEASKRVNEIDALRFLAACSVVIFHYAFQGYASGHSVLAYPLLVPVAKYGYLGVELFFMISGFVILMTASSGRLRRFTISRIVRLYPAFWACCTITFLFEIGIGTESTTISFGQYLANMTMLSQFARIAPVDPVYWTLAIEMQFYALVAVVLVFKKIEKAQLFLTIWLLATIVLDVHQSKWLRFFLIAQYAPFFIGGAVAFIIWSRGITLARLGLMVLAFLLSVYHSLLDIHHLVKAYNTPYCNHVVIGIVTVFFCVMLLIATRYTGWFGNQNWSPIGVLTYPLYLIHYVVGMIILNRLSPLANPHVILWGTVLAMLAVSWVVHIYVEQKIAGHLKKALGITFDFFSKRKAELTL